MTDELMPELDNLVDCVKKSPEWRAYLGGAYGIAIINTADMEEFTDDISFENRERKNDN